jgi:preprotein translocase subunit SecG
MYTFLLVLLIIDSVVLVAAILLQAGKGGGIAASFGGASSSTDAFIGTRQAGNLLTKASWTCGGIFLGLAFILSLMSTRNRGPRSVLDQGLSAPTPASAPATGGNANPSGAAVPLEPAGTPAQGAAPASPAPGTAPTGTPATTTPPAGTTPAPRKP